MWCFVNLEKAIILFEEPEIYSWCLFIYREYTFGDGLRGFEKATSA